MAKARLRHYIEVKSNELLDVIGGLPRARLEEPGVQGQWSVKDIPAHLMVWNNRLLRWIRESERGESPATPEPGCTRESIDRLNHDTYLKYKDAAYGDMPDGFAASYAAILARIDDWRDEELNSGERYDWSHGQPLWAAIGWNTFDHDRSHLDAIRRWMEKTGRP
jgi:hypothetical protein